MSKVIHHEKCFTNKEQGAVCSCPISWPRREENVNVKHARGGNCWVGVRDGDACPLHDEPRGDCSECPPCPACSLPVVPLYALEVA